MRSLFIALVAAVIAVSFSSTLLAQQAAAPAAPQVQLSTDPAAQKAVQARAKQLEAVAKGDRRAVEAESKLKTVTDAQAANVVATAKLGCSVTEAINRAAWNNNNLVEIACADGIGYMAFVGPNGAGIQARECIPDSRSPLPTPCTLPANANPAKGLQKYVTKAGSDCVVEKAVGLAASPTLAAYEVACSSGLGEMLTVSLPRNDASRALSAPCLAIATILPGTSCSLTSADANMAPVKVLATKSPSACPLKDQRYVGAANDGSDYYEFACQDGKGFMIQASEKGEYQRTLTCIQAANIGGGCKLSDTTAAIAAQHAIFTSQAKAAGIECEVNKFANFGQRAGSTAEAVEFGCGNRTESIVAVTNAGKTEIMNCARARLDGYTCSYSKPEDSYKLLTESLKQAGRTTCEVSGVRTMGASSRAVYLEVACADGAPGFVMSYPTGSAKPDAATACGMAQNLGGGCQLPANRRT